MGVDLRAVSGELIAAVDTKRDATIRDVMMGATLDVPVWEYRIISAHGMLLDLDTPLAAVDAGLVQDGADLILTLVRNCVMWHPVHKGSAAEIDETGRLVRRIGAGFDNAIAVSNMRTYSYSVRIVEVIDCHSGGLEIGFSSFPPSELPETLPNKLFKLTGVHISDPSGNFYTDADDETEDSWLAPELAWHATSSSPQSPQQLVVGDSLRCELSGGIFKLHINSMKVASWPLNIQTDQPLFPIVNVNGTALAIELLA